MEDIRDIKGPGTLPFEVEWWMWLLIALLLLGVGLFLFFKFKKKKLVEKVVAPVLIPPDQQALSALAALVKKKYPDAGEFKSYFFELSMILRRYLEGRFQIPVTDKTTEEFLMEMARSDRLNQSQKETLQLFLQQSDLIKFAKQESSVKECHESEGFVRRLIKETTPNKSNDI